MLKSSARKIFRWLAGRRSSQAFFEFLQITALAGMNIGTGDTISESGELTLIDQLARYYPKESALTLFDVGANTGDYVQALLDAFASHPQTRIFAFEPSPQTHGLLTRRFSGTARVALEPFGFGAEEETRTLFRPALAAASGIASLYRRRLDHFNIQLDTQEEVRIRTIDRFCEEQALKKIHLLKLDVEGHELSALKGAERMLRDGLIDFIQFEFGGCNIDSKTFFQDFYYVLNDRYALYRVLTYGLAPITAYREQYEAFITTNFLAARRDLDANFLRD